VPLVELGAQLFAQLLDLPGLEGRDDDVAPALALEAARATLYLPGRELR
jgi:hypothetical protein